LPGTALAGRGGVSLLALLLALGGPEPGAGTPATPSSGKWAALLPDLSLGLQVASSSAPATDGLRLSATTVVLVEARWPLATLEAQGVGAVWRTPAQPPPADGPAAPASVEPEPPEPTVSELQEAAEAAAAVHLVELPDWRGRARSSALLPELTAAYRRTVGDVDTFGIRSEVGIDSHNTENLSRYEIRATWQLSQLIFSREEMLAAASALEVQRGREELLTRIADHYYERRRLQLLQKEAGARERQDLQLRIDQQTATLDALTAGFLSRALARRKDGSR
jgi:hypothetical protein